MAECLQMITVTHAGEAHKVPCGKCGFCLTSKRAQWMFRVWHEMRTQVHRGYFLTLTYDEKHVKRTADGRLSLRFRDVQLYLKQIRKRKFYVKYICVGEYGAVTHRPHYHMLLWTDCPVGTLESIWARGKIHFGALTMASSMYTLKYIIQPKQKAENGLEKTRAQFSKGLGLAYLTKAVYNWHTFDEENPEFMSKIDGQTVALPRYYKDKIFTKWQRAVQRERLYQDKTRKFHEGKREWIARQGRRVSHLSRVEKLRAYKAYRRELRENEARYLLSKVKFNLTL